MTKTIVNCANCGKPKEIFPSQAKNKNHFCDIGCKGAYQSLNMRGQQNHMHGTDRSGPRAANFGKFKHEPKLCAYCGETFQPDTASRKYCSKSCYRMDISAKLDRACLHCGDHFTIYRSELSKAATAGKYCSRECYSLSIAAPQVEKVCEYCGATFLAKNSEDKRGGGRFCSPDCWYQINQGKSHARYKERLRRKCAQCGSQYTVRHGAERTSRFCSRSCQLTCTGESNPNWRGGKSFEPYPISWTRGLRSAIRQRDKNTCQVCGKKEKHNSRRLDVHHIDYDKHNLYMSNLLSLCKSCHAKTNHNREYWQEYFSHNKASLAASSE